MEIGAVVLLFPTIANWFSTLGYHEQSRAYADSVAAFDQQQLDRMIDQAREYNRQLPNGPLRDPYILNERGQAEDMRDRIPEYERQLDFGEGLPMAWVDIPSVNTALPIFHGTAGQTLERGAGHLHGSALPVGGESSHSVITAHSGLTTAKLF